MKTNQSKYVKDRHDRFENGITIVSLIITIIVLVILTATSVKAVFDMNFVEMTSSAAINYEKARIIRRTTLV